MDNKKIQKERITNYFIDATVNIIKEDGLENLTTKKIGDRAGYSYATIYNYFRNFNELICISMSKIAIECFNFVNDNIYGDSPLSRTLSFIDLMVDFNAKNINIYYPFLSSKVDFSYFQLTTGKHFYHPAYDLLIKELKFTDSPELIADIITSIFNSCLHFYIIMKTPENLFNLKENIKKQVLFVLEKYLK